MNKVLLALLVLASNAKAGEYGLLEPRDVYIDLFENETVHDPYLDPVDEELKYGAGFKTDFDVVRIKQYTLFVDSLLHFDQSERSGQVRHAGWAYTLGLDVFRFGTSAIQLIRDHHSRHIMEETRPMHFPVYDRVGIRFYLYKKEFK